MAAVTCTIAEVTSTAAEDTNALAFLAPALL
jgi:hypothetical protein